MQGTPSTQTELNKGLDAPSPPFRRLPTPQNHRGPSISSCNSPCTSGLHILVYLLSGERRPWEGRGSCNEVARGTVWCRTARLQLGPKAFFVHTAHIITNSPTHDSSTAHQS